MGYVEISHVACFRENRLSDPFFRRDRPQNRTQIVESQAFTCRIQLALFALFSAWFTNAGSGVTLGAGAWTLDGGRSRLRRPIRSAFLFSGFRRWGRLALRGPFRCKHRIELRKPRPGHQGPRVGASLPGHDRWGRLAIRGPFRCKHRIKHRKRRPGHQGPRVGAGLPGHDLAGNQIACRLVGDERAHELDIETLQRLESLPADDPRRGVWICHLGPLSGACIGCVQPINKV